MKPWQEEQHVEVVSMFGDVATEAPRRFPACGQLAPERLTRCDFGLFCDLVARHPGPHRGQPSSCNRPLAHEGDHMVITLDGKTGYEVIARW